MGGSGGVVVCAQGWGGGAYKVVVAVASCDHKSRGGEGFGSKYQKLCHDGSVLGTPCGTAMGDGVWGWHGGTYPAMVVGGHAVVMHEVGRGFG